MADPTGARGPSLLAIPEGDTHERKVCPDCGFIASGDLTTRHNPE